MPITVVLANEWFLIAVSFGYGSVRSEELANEY